MNYSEKGPPRGLTVKFIDSCRPQTRPYEVRDTISLLVLRIAKSGRRVLRLADRTTGFVLSLPWSPTPARRHVTLEQAREIERQFRRARDSGPDDLRRFIDTVRAKMNPPPLRADQDRPGIRTVRYVCEILVESHLKRRKRLDSALHILNNYILPATDPESPGGLCFGDLDIAKLTPRELAWPILYAIAKKRVGTARSVFIEERVLLAFAYRRGFIAEPLASRLRLSDFGIDITERQRILSETEIPTFWNCLATEGRLYVLTLAFRIILLTGVRVNQLCRALWSNVDLDGAVWTIPYHDRKLTNSLKRRAREKPSFFIPLSPQAVAMFRELKRLARGSTFVLPGRNPERPRSYVYLDVVMATYFGAWKGLPPRIPLPGGPVVIHDLRRTLRSHLTRLGVRYDVAERCLDHSLGDETYTVILDSTMDYFAERRAALNDWAADVERLVTAPSLVPIRSLVR